MRDEERPGKIHARPHERGARGDAPPLGGGEMVQLSGPRHAPGREGLQEMLPHRERRIVVGYGSRDDALRDQRAQARPVRILPRSEPRHHALETAQPRHETLGQGAVDEERLEAEGVERRRREHEPRTLE